MENTIVTIALCKKGIQWHDQDIYLQDGWNIQPSDKFLGIKGRVISKQVQEKPDWLDLSFADAKEIGIMNLKVKGFWILEMNDRVCVACFGGSEEFLNREKLDSSFVPYRIEVKEGELKSEVLKYLEAAANSAQTLDNGNCSVCGYELKGIVCHNCGANQGTEFLESQM